ncbi:hypothetical protein [Promicromonospora sp. NPDC023805]|uniref:hypothetical protein n=1 Tax=Promicromonospora sp. NPDC023805 TaxID=3154696 RepID=UPI0033EB3D90
MSNTYISMFTKYLAATPAGAANVGGRIARESGGSYAYWADFWRPLRNAFTADRRTTRDGQALEAATANVSDVKKKGPYAAAARNWAELAPQWDGLEHEQMPAASVTIGGLTVKVPAQCAERYPDGELEVLYARFNLDQLPDDVVHGVLRVLQRAFPTATSITFIDVARTRTYTTRGLDLTGYDAWLDQAGTELDQYFRDENEAA